MNTNEVKEQESAVLQVPVEDIMPNRAQPRVVFDDASLQELADSIKEHGIIQPLVLRKVGEKYEIVAGERRYRAAIIAGLAGVPAIITKMTDAESAEVALVENIQRKDLTAIEEARSYKTILDKGELSQTDLAVKMGVSQSAISNKLRLLSLDEEVQTAVLESKISERHARSLLKITDPEEQKELLHKIIEERLTVKQLETEIKKRVGNVPLVDNKVDVEKIKENAVDITPITIQTKAEEESSASLGSVMTAPPAKPKEFTAPVEEENPEEAPTPAPAPEKEYFNPMEEAAVNMNVDSGPSDIFKGVNDYLTKEEDDSEEVEMLDEFSAPPVSAPTPVNDGAVDKIKAVLVGKNYTINDRYEGNKHIINVEITS